MQKKYLKIREKINVGINLNATSMSFVVVKDNKSAPQILEQAIYPINDIQLALEKIKKSYDFPCYLTLSHRFIMIKTLVFSELFKEKEICELLTLNSEQYFSYPVDEIYFDYEFICGLKRKVRVIASKQELVQNWQKVFVEAKMKLKAVTVDVIAVERFLSYMKMIEKEKIFGVFVRNGDELLQIVFIDGFAFFVNSSLISQESAEFFRQEILKFFRLYELSKSYLYPVTHIICLGFDEKILQAIQAKLPLPVVELKKIYTENKFNQTFLLPLGIVLRC